MGPCHATEGSQLPMRAVVVAVWIFLGLLGSSSGASVFSGGMNSAHDGNSIDNNVTPAYISPGMIVICVALSVCAVLLVALCTDLCQKHSGFKDFENETYTDDNLSPVPAPSSEFTMYPPVENTPDSLAVAPVVFEPLPVITKRSYLDQDAKKLSRIRPRVVQDVHERSESVDSLDDITHRDLTQDKMRLQNMLTNSRQNVPRGQLQYIKELGAGWFGKVLQGEGHNVLPGHKKTKVVIQMLKEEPDTSDQLAFLEEVMPYRDTEHNNVVKLLGQCVDTAPFLNVLELCPFGDLKTYLRSHRVAMESFNEKGLLLKFACDMAAGLQALHQQGFIHRDFACRNCLLASDLSVKVGDYGISEETFKEDYLTTSAGDVLPIRWLAPECVIVSQDDVGISRITRESNIWAYGVSMWEILTFGSMPYGDLTNNHVLRLVVMEKSVKLPRPDVAVANLNRLHQLMELCWGNPEDRPSLRELRIMLLHLMSRKDDVDTSAFDMKWNQLMPRRSPRIVRVKGPHGRFAQSPFHGNGSVHTTSDSGIMSTTAGSSNLPSVLSGEDEEGPGELNISKIGLAGSRDSLNKLVEGQLVKKQQELASPVNEMSLEAEFSAANIAASSVEETQQHIVEAEVVSDILGGDSRRAEEFEDLALSEREIISPIKPDKPDVSADSTNATTAAPSTRSSQGQLPDVLVTNTASFHQAVPDFITSTPKKPEQRRAADPVMVQAESKAPAAVDISQSSLQSPEVSGSFHTAHSSSYSTQSSLDRSLSADIEDRSFMAPNKFADILKTVAMTPSVDDEMLDTSNENSPSVFDELSEKDLFPSPVKNLSDCDRLEDMDIKGITNPTLTGVSVGTEDTASGDHTPRNTPSPPLSTANVTLIDSTDTTTESGSQDKEVTRITQHSVPANDSFDEDRSTPTPASQAVGVDQLETDSPAKDDVINQALPSGTDSESNSSDDPGALHSASSDKEAPDKALVTSGNKPGEKYLDPTRPDESTKPSDGSLQEDTLETEDSSAKTQGDKTSTTDKSEPTDTTEPSHQNEEQKETESSNSTGDNSGTVNKDDS